MIKLIARLEKKVGQPNYSSLCAGLSIETEIDPRAIDDIEVWEQTVARIYSRIEQAVDAELVRLTGSAAEPVAATAPAAPVNGRQTAYAPDGEAAIAAARTREEPARNGPQKEKRVWQTASPRADQAPEREPAGDRDVRRPERRTKDGYGPPRNGKALFAWAKDCEEKGAVGFIKALGAWCKREGLPWKFNDLQTDEILAVYRAGQEMLENGGF